MGQAGKRKRLGKRTLSVLVHMLEDPHSTAVKTISQIAEEEGVDPSTLTRLGQRLGFDGFAGLQQVFRQHVSGRGGFYSSQAQSLLAESTPTFVRDLANQELKRLGDTVESLRREDIDRAVGFLTEAASVYVLSLRATYALGFFFSAFLRHVRPRVHLIGGPQDLPAELVQISPSDVLVAFSFRPYTNVVVEACRTMRARGVPIVAVTDIASPLAGDDPTLVTLYARSPFYFNAAISNLFIAEVLVSAVAKRLGNTALRHIADLEASLKQLSVERE